MVFRILRPILILIVLLLENFKILQCIYCKYLAPELMFAVTNPLPHPVYRKTHSCDIFVITQKRLVHAL